MFKSFNLKTNLVKMTVVLHKHKTAAGKHVLFTLCHMSLCCRKSLGQLQFHMNVFQFFTRIRHSTDIATVWMSFCNKYK